MPFVPVPGTAMVELFYRLDSQRCENTLYFRQADPYDVVELTTLLAEVLAWANTNLLPQMAADVLLTGAKATSLESALAPAVEVPAAIPGGVASPALPSNVAFAIKFLTAGRGRSARGRNYFFGLTEANVTGNTVAPTVVAALIDAYEQLLAPGVITEGAWSVVSRFENGAPRSPGIAQLVTSVSVTDATVDSQRRRLPGRGR